jgi:sugar/nucleoside kinase (ribokinase family)
MGGKESLRSVALGGVAWNTMVYLDAFPDPRPGTVFARGSYETVGSSGAGKALNLSWLGADAVLWGLIGDDDEGDRISAFVEANGVEFISAIDPAGTMRHVNLMDANGDRISIFANPGSQEIEVDVNSMVDVLRSADLVSVTILNYCRQFLPVLRNLGSDVWVDIHDYDGINPYHREFIDAADYLFMSSVAMPAWRPFLEERIGAGVTAAVCTHGELGASGLTAATGWVDIDAVPVTDIVDSNGAGDAFFAGFAVAWHHDGDLKTALQRGAEHAALAVQSPDLAPTR